MLRLALTNKRRWNGLNSPPLGVQNTAIPLRAKGAIHSSLIACGLMLFSALASFAQKDSLNSPADLQWQAHLGIYTLVANQDFQPLYHLYQQGGRFIDGRANTRAAVGYAMEYRFGKHQRWRLSTGAEAIAGYPKLSRLQIGYLNMSYSSFVVVAGRQPLKPISRDLPVPAVGDLGRSNNAPPIPKIGIKTHDFVPIPLPWFGKELFALHGALYHGWLESERHIAKPYWHEKHLHGRLGGPSTYAALVGGIRHYALWGGENEDGKRLYPINGHTYYRVLTGQDHSEEANAIGSHLGILELALEVYIGNHRGTIFTQKIFEDRGAFQWDWSRHDGILGLRYEPPLNALKLTRIEYNYLSTIWQEGYGIPDATSAYPDEEANNGWKFGGRDNLYNNYRYRSGYSYQGLLIGNPLLLTYPRAQMLNLEVRNYGHFVVSHRVAAHHLSLGFVATPALKLNLHITRIQHYGTYYGLYEGRYEWKGIHTDPNFEYLFLPSKRQWHTQLMALYTNPKGWNLSISWARDAGQLYHTHGMAIGAQYVWNNSKKQSLSPTYEDEL